MLISIDPGVRAIGLAVWSSGKLRMAVASIVGAIPAYDRDPANLDAYASCHLANIFGRLGGAHLHPPTSMIVMESMHWDGRRATTAEDLINVQTVGLLVAGRLAPPRCVALVPPHTWKGSIPKEIHHARILESLEASERAIAEAACEATRKANRKEILDAIGIGLYYLGRTTRGGGERT